MTTESPSSWKNSSSVANTTVSTLLFSFIHFFFNSDLLEIVEYFIYFFSCGSAVTTVMHAEMALEILRARKDHADQFDLVITDVHMPEMDGFKLLEVISLEMDIPVISNI
jgi:hypothetical protein